MGKSRLNSRHRGLGCLGVLGLGVNFRHDLYRCPLQVMAKVNIFQLSPRFVSMALTSYGETHSPLQVVAKLSFLPRVLNFRHSLYRWISPLQVMAKVCFGLSFC